VNTFEGRRGIAAAQTAVALALWLLAWPSVGGVETPVPTPATGTAPRTEIPQEAIDAMMCGSLANPAGPWDYRDPAMRGQITLINANHFNQDVQNLVRGETVDKVLGDLDFIMRTFPNHYPALQTASRYFLEGGKRYKWRTMECYFDRAMRFAPNDSTVRVLYGIYLLKSGKADKALDRFMEALDLSPDSAEIQYDIGLVYADMKDYKHANEYAAKAYQLGYPLLGLRHILERAGQWNPPALPPATPQAADNTVSSIPK
jgi:predicted Zn-dependent protease